jgi:hypothetical protein
MRHLLQPRVHSIEHIIYLYLDLYQILCCSVSMGVSLVWYIHHLLAATTVCPLSSILSTSLLQSDAKTLPKTRPCIICID